MMRTENELRAAVAAEARRWRGTPYHSNAGIFGVGCDCGQLLVRVFVDLGFVPPFDTGPYSQDWHLHRSEERYLAFVKQHLRQVATAGVGDVIVFRYGRAYSHGAIVVDLDPLRIVHAYRNAGMVVEDVLTQHPRLNEAARNPIIFSYWA